MIFEDDSQLDPGDVYDRVPYFAEYFEDEFDCEVSDYEQ